MVGTRSSVVVSVLGMAFYAAILKGDLRGKRVIHGLFIFWLQVVSQIRQIADDRLIITGAGIRLKGDLNGDRTVNLVDAIIDLQICVGLQPVTVCHFVLAADFGALRLYGYDNNGTWTRLNEKEFILYHQHDMKEHDMKGCFAYQTKAYEKSKTDSCRFQLILSSGTTRNPKLSI